MLKLLLLLLLIILFSCNYPDIDTVPKFNLLNISMEEALDKCKMKNISKDFEYVCNIEILKPLIDRL